MIILIINVNHKKCSVSLIINEKISYLENICYKNGNDHILLMIKEILNNNNLKINQLEAISFLNGPGHFTNIRMNISIAQGLSFGMNIPLISISILDIIAYKLYKKKKVKKILSIVNSDYNEIYIGKYQNIKGLWTIYKKKISINKLFNVKDIILKSCFWIIISLKGYLNIKLKNDLSNNINLFDEINSIDMIDLTIKYFNKNNVFFNKNINPIYLKKKFI
ncbi:tRNA (adenosine(37)-N6)-threonylcarbamoyltransferase complex dimerization subunit type 1 TsaB [Candidatus Annandia pinicola]|uniref:tRNA (adenosine(37)-N6)-threonylcarbamoyltransferase complex dimerization subunit type 1 TsaB n=1 Tax=Candidatus Annandia pinicola TaxID=1345117 RepID=UPI001D010B9D|nr:tRNA (adenosine(37)-N6)-threonylcarbamoyltransferase complex dimerization subunit type 1 TsaB [Candidatus Annandia pinicola]UDG80376.1 tRNA threonylcarbamoyladenosine biosynthesis protein TsaB [Candidatus Annandia pinicola]